MSRSPTPDQQRRPHFPNDRLRVWFLSDGTSPIALSLAQHLLQHGDRVVVGVLPTQQDGDEERVSQLGEFELEVQQTDDWADRFKVLHFDSR